MSEEIPNIEDEISDHKDDLNTWILAMEVLEVPSNSRGVVDRFKQDCQQLIRYIDENDTPSSSDLVDYTDRRNSLEIQYLNIVNNFR